MRQNYWAGTPKKKLRSFAQIRALPVPFGCSLPPLIFAGEINPTGV
jgi:hypothetical protein